MLAERRCSARPLCGEKPSYAGRLAVAGLALAVALLGRRVSPAAAFPVGGGGSSRTDCLAVFDAEANVPASKPQHIRCTDGDACDADGVVNGRCEFTLAVCANSSFNAACALRGVEVVTVAHARDDGDTQFDPEMLALQQRIDGQIEFPTEVPDTCTNETRIHVPVIGPLKSGKCKSGRKTVQMATRTQPIGGKTYTDKDKIKMSCDPAPAGCTPRALFAGTFDRIQRQIFSQSCAVGGCHDSQSRTGDLLLEPGAAYGNLVDAEPSNPAALAAGWRRVTTLDATHGDPATSLLVHKLLGPPAGFGARMPFGRPQLDARLIDVVQLWVAAGAPQTGWVPGTD